MSEASLVSLATLTLFTAGPAFAQDADQASAATEVAGNSGDSDLSDQAIVVTGSRLVSDGFEAPTPVTVVSTERLQQAAPSSIADALNQLPIFRNSNTPASTGFGTTGNVAQTFLNLRSLGPQRSLILLDGRRVVPSGAGGATDVSILPDQVVARTDIVTGGASAAYGSDAVAGVINFVLDTTFTGLRASLQAGIAERGNNANQRINLAGGFNIGDRGHLLVSGSYYNNEGIKRFKELEWFNSCGRIPNVTGATPSVVATCNVHSAGFTPGGLVPSGPLAGTEFLPGGQTRQFRFGTIRTSLAMVGGDGQDHGENYTPVPAIERYTGFAHFRYELTDNLTFFADFLGAEAKAHYDATAPWEGNTSQFLIQRDNAYLPAAIRARMFDPNGDGNQADAITQFPMNRYDYDFGLLVVDSRNRTFRGTAGFDIQLGDWKANVYYNHGENKFHQTTLNNPLIQRIYQSADAVVGPNGTIVCRSTLTAPNDGCVPVNLFGNGSPSRAALDYFTDTSLVDQHVKQDTAEATISGSPFSLWAGEVALAAGVGYRKESSVQTVDPFSPLIRRAPVPGEPGYYLGYPQSVNGQLGGFERGNQQPLSGSFNVKEIFAEVGLPLARELPFAYSLDLNGAIRYTDYSNSGGVTTWKIGAIYEPIPDIRFRATRSRDIRAANINELFTGSNQGQGTQIDPTFPVGDPRRTPSVIVRTLGNPDLVPERADTTTAGIVLQPRFLPGFSASADYFNIDIADAIATLSGQVTIDQCFLGATSLCQQITRDANGVLVSVNTPFLNVARRLTRGIDFEVSYRTRLGGGDTLSFRGLATYVDKLQTFTPGAPVLESAGQTGGGNGVPHWTANFDVNYRSASGFSFYAQERYIGPGALDLTQSPAQLAPEQNRVKRVFYTDVTLSQQVEANGHSMEFFLTVNNLFDKDPPPTYPVFNTFGVPNGGTNPTLFDLVGRQYTAGVRVRY